MAISIQREINTLKEIFEGELKGLDLKVSLIGKPEDPVILDLPFDYGRREAPAYFTIGREIIIHRKILWNKKDLKPVASIAIYKDGTLGIFVYKEEFSEKAELIKKDYKFATGKQANFYLTPEA